MAILLCLLPFLGLLKLSGAAPTATYSDLEARALSCPASNGAVYSNGGRTYAIECSTDRYGGDMPAPNGQYTGTFEACIESCSTRSGCMLANYVASSTACYLKSVANSKSANSAVWGAVALAGSSSTSTSPKATSRPSSPQVTATPVVAVGKRGLAYNDATLTGLFAGQDSKVSWAYNWDSASYGASSALNYVPLLHDNGASHTSVWNANVGKAISTGSNHAMSFNEPDQCGTNSGGACMQDIKTVVKSYKDWIQPLVNSYPGKLKLGAPAVTNGVLDTSTGSPMGLPWLQQFIGNCTGCQIDFICIHWYDSPSNVAYFKSHVQDAYAAGGNRPVWITEFAPTSGTDAQKQGFLKQVLPWLDSLDYVERYAYQMTAKNVLVSADGTGLTPLGQVYNTI
ncbi:glycoside hydrolase family 128 protein [Glonium stellatum]|uniref:Glycoside hydrolase family 128 protein n=1 Tax=Glonium stellatum TaxID=574774 RepID=A0A8E2F324_9PEZI|nr:glycoside hydrolase family 128 protein [Glonium stellatum]